MRWLHEVRLYPNKSQINRLGYMLHVTRDLYNAALQQRRDAWIMHRRSVKYRQQYRELTELRRENARLRSVYRELEDAVLHRLDLAYRAFLERLARGEKAGPPRFRPARHWRQLEFPHGDRALKLDAKQQGVRIPGVGSVQLRKGREIPEYGRAFVLVKNDEWYAVFECQREPEPLAATGKSVGLDRGIRVLAALSDGQKIPNSKIVEQNRERVTRLQRELERRTQRDARGRVRNRRDPKRQDAVRKLARAKQRERNARRDALHKASRQLVRDYDLIAIETLKVSNMLRSAKGTVEEPGRNVRAKAGLNRAIADAGWGILVTLLREKASNAARVIVEVPAKDTSRTCPSCRLVSAKNRKGSLFRCVGCGHSDDADVNAAKNILARAQAGARESVLSSGDARLDRHDDG